MARASETLVNESGDRIKPPRQVWLDAMRALAVLGMIETHTVNTLLGAPWREGGAYASLTYVNGLVAPAFLWIAGQAHGLASSCRSAEGRRPWPTVRRLLGILALGYLLHVPWPGSGTTWRQFFAVDVLHCLAASLLVAVAAQRCFPRHQENVLAAAVVGILAAGAWLASGASPAIGFWPMDAWIDQGGDSQFPIVPWAAFVGVGIIMAGWRLPWWGWSALGAGLLALPSPTFMARSSPAFFLERLGWLVLAATAVRGVGKIATFPAWFLWLGRESLALYVAHLSLLHVLLAARLIGPQLAPAATALAAAAVAAASVVLAWLWRRWRTAAARRSGGC